MARRAAASRAVWTLALWVSLWAQAASPPQRTDTVQIVDRVVASIEGRALTLSELSWETRVALIQRGGLEAASAPLDDDLLLSSLDVVVGQRLQLIEADRLGAYPVEEQEVEKAVADFRNRFRSEADFQRFLTQQQADIQTLGVTLARQLRAAKILDSKVRLRAQVSEREVRQYYEAHARELAETYDAVRQRLKEKLVRERYALLVGEELENARKSADVRLIAPFARRGAAR